VESMLSIAYRNRNIYADAVAGNLGDKSISFSNIVHKPLLISTNIGKGGPIKPVANHKGNMRNAIKIK
jgi:hypothetical protein